MTREKMIGWMKVAIARREMSKCVRAKYATIILDRRGREVSSGVNGKPVGSICDDFCFRQGLLPDANAPRCCLHSEQNALVFGNFSEYENGSMIVSGIPCADCALLICQSGIKELICLEDDRGYTGLGEFLKHGIPVEASVLTKEEVGL